MKKKICLIGLNYGGNVLIKSINEIKSFNLVGVCGQKDRKLNNPPRFNYYVSWRKMIKELKPDIVVIAVPPIEQKKILKYLLSKKIPFFCQKPLTNNIKDINKLFLLNKKSKKKNLIDLNFISIPAIIKFRQIVENININHNTQVEVKWNFKPLSINLKNSWKNNKKQMGGEINNFFFHLVSVIYFIFKVKNLIFIKKKKKLFYFQLNIKNSRGYIIFNPSNDKNLFSVKVSKKNLKYNLENKSKDYHNNFVIKKNNKIIYKNNFLRGKSRICASKKILNLFVKRNKDIEKYVSFAFGLLIQKKIIKLNAY